MLRIFCFIFSVMVLIPQLSLAENKGGDTGGGNEQGNANKGDEFCKKYNLCAGSGFESNSLKTLVSYLRRLRTENFEQYQSLEYFVFNYSHAGNDFEMANLLREAFKTIDSGQ